MPTSCAQLGYAFISNAEWLKVPQQDVAEVRKRRFCISGGSSWTSPDETPTECHCLSGRGQHFTWWSSKSPGADSPGNSLSEYRKQCQQSKQGNSSGQIAWCSRGSSKGSHKILGSNQWIQRRSWRIALRKSVTTCIESILFTVFQRRSGKHLF